MRSHIKELLDAIVLSISNGQEPSDLDLISGEPFFCEKMQLVKFLPASTNGTACIFVTPQGGWESTFGDTLLTCPSITVRIPNARENHWGQIPLGALKTVSFKVGKLSGSGMPLNLLKINYPTPRVLVGLECFEVPENGHSVPATRNLDFYQLSPDCAGTISRVGLTLLQDEKLGLADRRSRHVSNDITYDTYSLADKEMVNFSVILAFYRDVFFRIAEEPGEISELEVRFCPDLAELIVEVSYIQSPKKTCATLHCSQENFERFLVIEGLYESSESISENQFLLRLWNILLLPLGANALSASFEILRRKGITELHCLSQHFERSAWVRYLFG